MSLSRVYNLIAVLVMMWSLPAFSAGDYNRVLFSAERYKLDALKMLEVLVNTDSGSGYEPGLNFVRGIVITELEELGFNVDLIPDPIAKTSHIVATLHGSGHANILLMAHMDTVFKEGTAAQRPFHISGGRAYGPGVMDDKGGIVIGIYALKALIDNNFENFSKITFLLDASEESGSEFVSELIRKVARVHDVALNLEPGRPGDGLVLWRKGSATAVVEVKGKSAHAGVAPELGQNAAVELAHQVLQLGKLGNQEMSTTINFTILNSGERKNVIPDYAIAKADVRSAFPEEFQRVERELGIVSARKAIPDTDVITKLVPGLPPMPKTPASEKLLTIAQKIYGEIGRELTVEGSGGAADASLSASVGTPTLDGFGIVGGNIHTPEEYADVDSIIPRIYLLSRMIMDVSNLEYPIVK